MTTKKKSKKKVPAKSTVNLSLTFSKNTAGAVDDIASQPVYRNNRSMAVESMVVTSPEYKRFTKKRSRKKQS